MKVPYPTISDSMALKSHMYICRTAGPSCFEFIKCQTLKPYMLIDNPMRHYWDENADITRNPFLHKTRIDCDKTFRTYNVSYNDALRTTLRPDINDEVFISVEIELLEDGYDEIDILENDLKFINSLIR